MIHEIHIKNLALIEELTLEFEEGFTIFTGETGAGKSILIGAIGLLLGERASADMVRNGFDEAEVSGVFELTTIKGPLQALLDEHSISPEGGQLIIRRKISRNDRNRILINQVPVPLGSLKLIGNYLVDFHGQHEHQSLLNETEHVKIIDNLPEVQEKRQAYNQAFSAYSEALQQLTSHKKKAEELAEKKEILEFQNKEIKSLALQSGEEATLENELSLLSSSTERISCASEILSILSTGSEPLIRNISLIRKKLETLCKYDNSIESWLNDIETTLATFTELETFCGGYLDKAGEGADPARIELINARLAKIQRLKKKYNCTLDKLIEKQKTLEKDLAALENASSDLDILQKNVSQLLQNCLTTGTALTNARTKSALSFDKKISVIMSKLGFTGGKLTTILESVGTPGPDGLEVVKFHVQTNAGEPFLPLAKTASGGEISRIMLAIKSVLAEHDQIPVLIFDEIDTGIGGVLASEVGKAMYSLSKSHQLLCISHLHQIASFSDNHFRVYKQTIADRTVTNVDKLDKEQKIMEIARMMGGNSEISIKHARELVEKAPEERVLHQI